MIMRCSQSRSRLAISGVIGMAIGLTIGIGACSDNGPVTYDTPLDASVVADQANSGAGVRQVCDDTHACRTGLACNGGFCVPAHSSGDGTPCTISAECTQGDYCGPNRACTKAGSGADGSGCKSDADCASGLRCDFIGLSAVCKPEGATDQGGACASSADCYGGLACANRICTPLPASPGGLPPLGISTWKGETCVDDPGPTKAYFRVPRGTNDGDFYRLPFPNDVRMKSGHLDLSHHPTPGTELLGLDIVDRYLRDLEQNADGFSAYPTVTMRFNAAIDFSTIQSSIHWIELGAAGTGTPVGFGWTATTARNQYLCANSVSARPAQGAPLKPGGTYAFFMTSELRDTTGKAVVADDDLKALLGGTAPTEAALATEWPKYAGFRAYAAANFGVASVLGAAVFTVGQPTVLPSKIAAAVAAAPSPTAGAWVKCDGSNASPCPQASGDRACGAVDPTFDEFHTLVSLPIFQRGTEPYEATTDGGDIVLNTSGVPAIQRNEQVCLALTVPKGTMPAAGWPLVIYAHGTGGSFRSHVTEGVAAMLAAAKDASGAAVPMAVLGIDQVEHGTRRGASTESPDTLFYNFANPLASRGNPLQGAADQASLVRFTQGLSVPAGAAGSAVKFGPIAFWGHSQGATVGAIAMPYVAGVSGVVLSGEGASLVDALLTKRNPVDIADVLPSALGEATVDAYHPVLTILQNALDVADPLNHAAGLAYKPATGMAAKHIFQPYGLSDTFAPPPTEATFALAAGLGFAAAAPSVLSVDPIGGYPASNTPTPVPAGGNLVDGTRPVTAFVREYQPSPPSSYDGHFVVYKDATARADVARFLAGLVGTKTPVVGAP